MTCLLFAMLLLAVILIVISTGREQQPPRRGRWEVSLLIRSRWIVMSGNLAAAERIPL